MAPKKGGPSKQPPRTQYFNAIREQKMDTLRWCLKHGGVSTRTEDEDGHTGVQLAAAAGLSEALDLLLENILKVGTKEDVEEVDEDGRTPLMMAAYNGKLDCVKMLVLKGKAPLATKCEAGKTAMDYAVSRKHDKVVAFLKDPKAKVESEDEEDEEDAQKARVFKASMKLANAVNEQEEVHKRKVEAADALQAALAKAPEPVWEEVAAVLKDTRRELSIRGKAALPGGDGIDPVLWNCVCLNELRLEWARKSARDPNQPHCRRPGAAAASLCLLRGRCDGCCSEHWCDRVTAQAVAASRGAARSSRSAQRAHHAHRLAQRPRVAA